ncbi:MAG TPA: FAD-binding protein, partial [Pseudonocardiaceae bacterium]
ALGAELACSRPVAEGLGWLPTERYVGVSGATIRPDLYLAVGISGQVQHMAGVNHAKVIVAINRDKNAPVFAQADLGVVADLYDVLPALTKALSH